MTSRRSFLGLLAAAPLVAPAIAKAAAEPNLISCIPIARGERITINSHITVKNGQRFKDWSDGQLRNAIYSPASSPNRLHGVAVNADGDAI